MAFFDILVGIFTLANTFIALFIVVYAFMFLNKTKSHKDRRPWDYLFLASIIYFIYTLFLMFLQIYGVQVLFENLDLYKMSIFFQFIYTGLILLSFISQTDLIFNNEIIIIMKKDSELLAKLALEKSQKEHVPIPTQTQGSAVNQPAQATPLKNQASAPAIAEKPKPEISREKLESLIGTKPAEPMLVTPSSAGLQGTASTRAENQQEEPVQATALRARAIRQKKKQPTFRKKVPKPKAKSKASKKKTIKRRK